MNGPIEPHADFRQVAATLRQNYLALTQQGFTPTQALALTQTFLSEAMRNNREGDGS